jgi:hypothetical protein
MKRIFLIFGMLMITSVIAANATAIISGVVSDSSGVPIKGIYVALRTTIGEGAMLSSDTTDATGAYSMTCDSTSGKYVLRTIDPKNVYTTQNDSLWLDGMDKPIAIKMSRPKYSTLSGIVTDSASGAVVVEAVVRVGMKADTTDGLGAYGIDSVQNGPRSISVSAEGYYSKTISIAMPYSAFTFNIKLVKLRYNTLSGTIKDSLSNQAIAGAIVRIGTKADTTDTTGKYLLDSLHAGAMTISVSPTGYHSRSISMTMPDSSLTFDIKLVKVKLNPLSGTITDSASNQKIVGAVVRIANRSDTTDTAGAYYFDTLPMGVRTLSVSATGYTSKTLNVTISDSALTFNIKLVKIHYGTVSGVVYDSASDVPVAGAIVSFQNSASIKPDTVGSDGKFEFQKLSFGTYTLKTSAVGYIGKVQSVVIMQDTTPVKVTVKLSKPILFTVSGKVTDSLTGAAIRSAVIIVRNASNVKVDSAFTDASGQYSIINSVSPGYQLRISANNYYGKAITLTGTTSAAQTINVQLVMIPTATKALVKNPVKETITVSVGRLSISNFAESGTVRLLNLKGELVFVQSFSEGATSCIALGQRLSTGSYILEINRKNAMLKQRVFIR